MQISPKKWDSNFQASLYYVKEMIFRALLKSTANIK